MAMMKALGVGFFSFLGGIAAWYVLYVGLTQPFVIMEPLSSEEEIAFRITFVAMTVFSGALAFGLGWLAAKRFRASFVLTICVVFALIAAVTYPLGLYSSLANDCGLGVESFPFPVHGCD